MSSYRERRKTQLREAVSPLPVRIIDSLEPLLSQDGNALAIVKVLVAEIAAQQVREENLKNANSSKEATISRLVDQLRRAIAPTESSSEASEGSAGRRLQSSQGSLFAEAPRTQSVLSWQGESEQHSVGQVLSTAEPMGHDCDVSAISLMCIEDEPIQRKRFRAMADAAGYEKIVMASSGEEAMAHVTDGGGRPDLVVCDINLGGVDGVTVLRQMRQVLGKGTAIVMLSSHEDKSMIERCIA